MFKTKSKVQTSIWLTILIMALIASLFFFVGKRTGQVEEQKAARFDFVDRNIVNVPIDPPIWVPDPGPGPRPEPKVVSLWTDLDMAVKSLEIEPAYPVRGEKFLVKIKASNQGRIPLVANGLHENIAYTVNLLGENQASLNTLVTGKFVIPYPIRPGQSFTIETPVIDTANFPAGNDFLLEANIDTEKAWKEKKETNNSEQKSFYLADSAGFDLEVSELTVNPSQVERGQTVSVQARITNRGNQGLSSFDYKISQNNAAEPAPYFSTINAWLAPGQEVNISYDINTANLFEQVVQVTVNVDPNNQLVEINENNNTGSDSYVIQGLANGPDLSFTAAGLAVSPHYIQPGFEITVSGSVKNNGNQESPVTRIQFFKVSGANHEVRENIGTVNVQALRPDLGAGFVFRYFDNSQQANYYKILAKVDPGNLIVEQLENNNSLIDSRNGWYQIDGPQFSLNEMSIQGEGGDPNIEVGEPNEIRLQVRYNPPQLDQEEASPAVAIVIYRDNQLLRTLNIGQGEIPANEDTIITTEQTENTAGQHSLRAVLDPEDRIDEVDDLLGHEVTTTYRAVE